MRKNPPTKEYKNANLRKYYHQRKGDALAVLGGKCVVCGIIERLHFDHVDPTTKSFDITWGLTHVDADTLQAELKKCQLLCDTHHYEKCAVDGSRLKNRVVGERHGLSKLRDLDVKYVRELARLGYTRRAIAAEFNVAHSAINDIVNGRTWSHV